MKYLIAKHLRFKSIHRVIEKYPADFAGNPEILAAIELFAGNNNRIAELLTNLSGPRSLVHSPKVDLKRRVRVSMTRMSGMGILIGTRQNDEPKINMYKAFKQLSWRNTNWVLHQNALKVAAELAKDQAIAGNSGLSAEKLATFQNLVQLYGEALESTDVLVSQRKSDRQELNTLMTTNSGIMRAQLDPYVIFEQEAHPDLYREYMIAHRWPSGKKQPGEKVTFSEISGSVINNATSDPLAGATVMITELELVAITDADGYYLFDEVPAGRFTLSCHSPGFVVPANATVIVDGTESLELNFSLDPVAGEQAA
jgi:hypothetical protein